MYSIPQINEAPLVQGKGFFLVVIGPDGSGKTTVAHAIGSFWEENFRQRPLYIHGDFGFLPRLKYLRQLWAKLRGREPAADIDYTRKHAGAEVSPHSLLKSLAYVSYYYWDFLLGHFKILLTKSSGKLVLADRYFYDYFFQRGNMKLPHWLLRVLCCFIPKPDMVVFLDADAEQIYARKNELTVAEITRQQEIIEKLRRHLPNMVKVNTNSGVDKTVQQVKESMMREMSRRFK